MNFSLLCLFFVFTQATANKLRFEDHDDLHPHRRHHHATHALHRKMSSRHQSQSQSQASSMSASSIPGACDASVPPENGLAGDCSAVLASGGTCTPSCNLGYAVSGVSSCNSGTFVSATCTPSSCFVKAPQNGTMGTCGEQLPHLGKCQPSCNTGFTVTGASSCSFGAFSSATCSPSYCVASAPTNGKLGNCPGQLPHGSSCSPTCNTGYSLSGLSRCTYGTFASASCIPSPCDASQPPANGKVGNCPAQLGDGQKCQPKCNAKFLLSGETSCSLGQLTSAVCLAESCPVGAPLNGAVGNCPYDDGRLGDGGTCTPTCNPGYTLSGPTSCKKGALAPGSTCSPSGCVFTAPDNGVADTCSSLMPHGTTCAPKCNAGYTLQGLTNCTFGSLSSAACTPNPCTVTAPLNGNKGTCPDQLTHMGTCTPGCNVGYSVKGLSSCNIGTLSSASCEPARCTVQAPTNGTFGDCQGQLDHGKTCTPGCNAGYAVSGISTCSFGSLQSAVCNPLSCATQAPANGASGNCQGQLQHGGICAPSCAVGYTLSGFSSCSFGTFTSATCDPSSCSVEAPTNGGIGDCNATLAHDGTCTPSCNTGYKLSGVTSCTLGAVKQTTCEQVAKTTLLNNGQNYCSAYCGNNMNNELAGWAGACCAGATNNKGKKISCTETSDSPIKCRCYRNDAVPFATTNDPKDASFICSNSTGAPAF
jgi:hypothetical protein